MTTTWIIVYMKLSKDRDTLMTDRCPTDGDSNQLRMLDLLPADLIVVVVVVGKLDSQDFKLLRLSCRVIRQALDKHIRCIFRHLPSLETRMCSLMQTVSTIERYLSLTRQCVKRKNKQSEWCLWMSYVFFKTTTPIDTFGLLSVDWASEQSPLPGYHFAEKFHIVESAVTTGKFYDMDVSHLSCLILTSSGGAHSVFKQAGLPDNPSLREVLRVCLSLGFVFGTHLECQTPGPDLGIPWSTPETGLPMKPGVPFLCQAHLLTWQNEEPGKVLPLEWEATDYNPTHFCKTKSCFHPNTVVELSAQFYRGSRLVDNSILLHPLVQKESDRNIVKIDQ